MDTNKSTDLRLREGDKKNANHIIRKESAPAGQDAARTEYQKERRLQERCKDVP